MEFEVLFSDNDIVWKRWDQDLAETVQFEEYCRENPVAAPEPAGPKADCCRPALT